jgi:glycosyltransferase involved in cell wall biosynthesis
VKVLCFIDSLAPGGAETSLASLAPEYAMRGIDLEVAYFKNSIGLHGRFERAGIPLFDLSAARGRSGRVRAARSLILERRPDLVHTTLFEADIAGRLAAWTARVPVVSSLVNVEYGPEQFADPRISGMRLRAAQLTDILSARPVVRWHAITEHVAGVMAERLRIRRDRIDVVPRGRDPQLLGTRTVERRARTREELGIGPEDKLILAAARQEHQKGLDVLLRAMPAVIEKCPRARLVVAGREGNQTLLLESTMARLQLDGAARFLGARGDVPDLLAAADAFAFPSRFEGLGSVLIEAMALEAPIVATELPAIREILHDGEHALLIPAEQPDALASSLVSVLENPGAGAARAGAARRRFLELYTIEAVANGMTRFFERALGSSSGRPHTTPNHEAPLG